MTVPNRKLSMMCYGSVEMRVRLMRRATPQQRGYITPCLIWTGPIGTRGYGLNYVSRRVSERVNENEGAHVTAYRVFIGKFERGLVVCHRCDQPACINPEHLFVGTQSDNLQDAMNKGRRDFSWMRGERNYACKLSAAQVKDITERPYYRGVQRDMAKEFGVGQSHISGIRSHKKRAEASID